MKDIRLAPYEEMIGRRPELEILSEALETYVDREQAYGHPLDTYTPTAAMWEEILGVRVTPEKLMLCMIAAKIGREMRNHKRDNIVDIAGYAKCYDEISKERGRRDVKAARGEFTLPD